MPSRTIARVVCHACGRPVEAGQRFCGGCGAPLRGVTDPTEVVPTADPTGEWAMDDPVWAATGAVPATVRTTDLPVTQAVTPAPWALHDLPDATPPTTPAATGSIDPVWAPAAEGYGPARTAEMPATAGPIAVTSVRRSRFRLSAVTVLGVVLAIVALVGSFTVAIGIESDGPLVLGADAPPTFRTGTWYVDDLGDNLSIAVLLAVVLTVAGGVAAGFRWRWGSGLAAGGGLAMTGLAALSIGLAQFPVEAARQFAAIPNTQAFTLTVTRDIGYWLLVVSAALGLLVFFTALNDAFGERRRGLNPWIAALGALATVVTVLGPTLPEGTAVLSDNWYRIEGFGQPSALLLVGRLVQLGLLAFTGIAGYLSVRRWGLGLAIGGALPCIWLAVSALFGITDNPIGPAYRNPGATDADLHGVTIIGISAVLAMAILGLVFAYDQSTRERR